MKEQVEVKGFRFQVYCPPDNVVHIHSPEETDKLTMDVGEARKGLKRFCAELRKLKDGETADIGNFIAKLDEKADLFIISLGTEKEKVSVGRFLDRMDEFRKLVKED